MRAAIDAADAGRLVAHALSDPGAVAQLHRAAAVDVIAAGKAATAMLAAFAETSPAPATRASLAVGVGDAGHPVPDERSVAAARRARTIAEGAGEHDLTAVLISGGASALMSLPIAGVTLDEKGQTVRRLLEAGADIGELNTVRKHVSAIKGGHLAAACRGSMLTLAVSDVVGDDLAVIGSGPTVADPSTFADALDVLERRGGRSRYPNAIVATLERGARGLIPETPKPGDPRLARSRALVIGGRADALSGARAAAQALGYQVRVIEEPVVGEARTAAQQHAARLTRLLPSLRRPACILSAGETTVRVTGRGRGGRNQEFALALADPLSGLPQPWAALSAGTDGIDGPTEAAGALIDHTTIARAAAAGLPPDRFLADNDSYRFFQSLNDLLVTGPTATNVGDVQVVLIGE